jgi:hypothetical protein
MCLRGASVRRRVLGSAVVVVCAFWLAGCAPGTRADSPPDYGTLVPVKGVVTFKGKPVPGAVVTFLPPKWAASNGETAADGSYALETAGKPGALPGEYKVAVSYLVSADGEPQGLGPRSAMSPAPGMATARERVPPEFSDFSRTTLRAAVRPGGGTFDFDLPVELATE